MPYSNRVLVIDDRQQDGEAIVRRLWSDQISSCFIQYDENIFEAIHKKFHGIRIIFQDIKLYPGTGTPDHSDYGAAANLLETLLDERNGPWLMVAWSTWGQDPENGDKYAKELFEYLIARLSDGKKPYNYVVFDKKPYTRDSNHEPVKGEDELDEKQKADLLTQIKTYFDVSKPISALGQWERDVIGCSSDVVSTLWEMTNDLGSDRETELSGLLQKLAKAQNGRLKDDISGVLYEILATLLSDRLSYMQSNSIKLAKADFAGRLNLINTMLHWCASADSNTSVPGSVLMYPDDISDINIISFGSVNKKNGFKMQHFIPEINQWIVKGCNEFFDKSPLVMLDVTPPCDHDLRKAYWRRYIVGIKILNDNLPIFVKNDGKLSHDALYMTPMFLDRSEEFGFIFNSRLVCSLEDKDRLYKRIAKLGRLREQILRDIVNWYGRMATRPGVVEVMN